MHATNDINVCSTLKTFDRMLASKSGLGGFISTLSASLAGSYVNGTIDEATGRLTTISETSRVEFEHNGSGFKAVNVGFNQHELNDVIRKIKENIFAESLDEQHPTELVVKRIETIEQDIATGQKDVEKTAEHVDITEAQLRDTVKQAIGDAGIQQLVEGKPISKGTKSKVVKALSASVDKLKKERTKLNLHAPMKRNKVQQATLQTQNELIDEKIQKYSTLQALITRSEQLGLHRSNSLDNLIQDTYIRQGMRAVGNVAGAFSSLAQEADTLSHNDYIELQRSRLPESTMNNPEVLAKLSAGYALYKGVAKVGEGLSALDDATGNIVSGALHKVGEGFEWIGTQTRRFVRDDLGYGQRIGQNAGDLAQFFAEIFAPGAVVKSIGSASKIIGTAKFRSAIGHKFGLFKGDVSASEIGLNWKGAIIGEKSYGMAFENYIATLPEFADIRLPKNFKTFDFWDVDIGRAVSVKTLDTNKPSYLLNPENVYNQLKRYVDKTVEFTRYDKGMRPDEVTASMIKSREIRLGIPADTGLAQMQQILQAVKYGEANNVKIVLTRIGK